MSIPTTTKAAATTCREIITNRNSPDFDLKIQISAALQGAKFTDENVPSIAYRQAMKDGQPRVMVTTLQTRPNGDRATGVQVILAEAVHLAGYVTNSFNQAAWRIIKSEIIEISDNEPSWKTASRVLEVVESLGAPFAQTETEVVLDNE